MTRLEDYLSERLAHLSIETTNQRDCYKKNGYFKQETVTDIRKRAHELKMLCEFGIGDENLISLSKMVYNRIVEIDESNAEFY